MSSSNNNTSSRLEYLKSLPSIRERCSKVFELARQDKLQFWSIHESVLPAIVDYCFYLIQRDFGSDYKSIPPHGRWRHFLANGRDRISPFLKDWSADPSVDPLEVSRRLVDLFVVAVLMDAGAGDEWTFVEPVEDCASTSDNTNVAINQGIGRSEGLAIGTLHAFKNGVFSSDPQNPHQVDATSLKSLTTDKVAQFMQSTPSNQMVGLDGRAELLKNLGNLLLSPDNRYFVSETTGGKQRPGNLIDYLMSNPLVKPIPRPVMRGEIIVPIELLWEAIIDEKQGLGSIWPKEGREPIDGKFIGDVWTCEALKNFISEKDAQVPFHKLSQWLTYSLIEVIEKTLDWKVTGKEHMTGLPEYRNGGLLIDFEYIQPKPLGFVSSLSLPESALNSFDLIGSIPPLPASHPAIIEWRALTVIGLDNIKKAINLKIKTPGSSPDEGSDILSLPQILEAATWKGGREIAKTKRSVDGKSAGPPIKVISDGTIF
ncbi:hypothetical protein BY996DRAFT_7697085 [Phakopsora pachyrhizi]|uniref:DUF1688-domain-containing protein n=1 Tax=Phakopsora pachyrhizi TaxID=170000 RepID=A0AAV0B9U2_PHAPC|nr:hypothetical protein BY996DRAFT_7697085 [Phakopsora pachyrhizi]CAH7682682.1 hypothetical protein PPACK8108_LOCUS15748 [Phakopsora pachyrhizi]